MRRESLPSVTSVADSVFYEQKDDDDVKTPTVDIDVTDDSDTLDNYPASQTESEGLEQTVQHLDAIKEVDEHSNYGVEESANLNDVSVNDTETNKYNKPETKPVTLVDTKRKLFSRQSSSASLTKNTDSFGDSGIETMDSVNCSEIRDQPDVYDVDMSEEEPDDPANTPRQQLCTPFKTSDIYSGNEDDEDMIEAHHVHESLSRVSSNQSLDKLETLDTEQPTDRVRNFVIESTTMYVEVQGEPDPELNQPDEEFDQRFDRAKTLQKAILKHSATAPQLTVYKSNVSRPQTARPSENGIQCSQIDIDLTCEAPPKADIKSYRQFNDRIKSAKTYREIYSSSDKPRNMSVIDMVDKITSTGDPSPSSERCRWPLRPLTRPRSPLTKRPQSRLEKQISLELQCISVENAKQKRNKVLARARSANFDRRCVSPVHQSPKTPLRRPQTACLPYTTSKLDTDRKREVLVTEPFANSDELYPNKAKLTSCHHGFKSIWPIGRKINLIQNKRPFESFELNSYSRAIERSQFPFRGDHSISVRSETPTVVGKEPVKPLTKSKNVMSLAYEPAPPSPKPAVKRLALYLSPNSTPRTVR